MAPARFELRRHPWLLSVAFFLLLCAVNVALQPSFLRPMVMMSNVSTFLPLVLVAIGQTYVVLAGDIDLSVGTIISLVNVVVVTAIEALGGSGAAILGGILIGCLTGVAAGVFNGVCVAVLRFQPIVTTFATGIIFAGLALWVLPQAGTPAPEAYWRTYAEPFLGLRLVVWLLAAAVVFVLVIARTRYYRSLLATGGNIQAAFQTGLPVIRIRIAGYALSGLFAAFAALCLVGETASGDPLLGGAFTLSSVSAVVLGGTALSGGIGGAIGSVFGAMILGLINNVIFFAGLPFEFQGLVQGLIVLVALAGGVFVSRR
ncbi:MAG TPA: ABC transporter permease [Alphaproteobacteria bacterium]|nr:ABC transporter permease [Alphaproteobacteria bacterium]